MEISKTLKPGKMGTKRFLKQYGDKLVCVRYRINKQTKKRYTTVEIIVDERPYIEQTIEVIVWLKIGFMNKDGMVKKLLASGATWLVEQQAWETEYETAKKLGLEKRIIKKTIK